MLTIFWGQLIMIKKPTKPWKNLEEARKQVGIYLSSDNTAFPCLACHGRGGVRDSADLCPVEGYKMAPLYKCQVCKGSGEGSRKAFMVYYRERNAEHKAAMEVYRRKKTILRELLAFLGEEDLGVLAEHFRGDYSD